VIRSSFFVFSGVFRGNRGMMEGVGDNLSKTYKFLTFS